MTTSEMMLAAETWTFEETMDNVAKAFEVVGVLVIVAGGLYALVHGFRVFEIDGILPWRRHETEARIAARRSESDDGSD